MDANNGAIQSLDSVVRGKLNLLDVSVGGLATSPSPSPIRRPISPICDESVQGYPDDTKPSHNGVKQIVSVIELIEGSGTLCCMVGEPALIYYGAKRIMFDWLICVPTESLGQVNALLQSHADKYEPFRPNALQVVGSLKARFPRFKVVGQAVFFLILSTQACNLCLTPSTIEYDRWIYIPYPTLPNYAQSLLDTWNLTDLEDLIDGMNLSTRWGEENLVLDGSIDQEWACWRERLLAGRELTEDELPRWTKARRDVWNKVAADESKKRRQGWKSRPEQLTRFWTFGQQDPRLRIKDYS